MSDNHDSHSGETHSGLSLGAMLGGLIAAVPGVLSLLLSMAGINFIPEAPASSNPTASIEERIKPVGEVVVAAAPAAAGAARSGEQIVTQMCSACHAVGALGSPKIGDTAAWAPRIEQGYNTLVKHAIEGIRSMPARGGAADLTDAEVADAVAYMANKAGAKFKAATK